MRAHVQHHRCASLASPPPTVLHHHSLASPPRSSSSRPGSSHSWCPSRTTTPPRSPHHSAPQQPSRPAGAAAAAAAASGTQQQSVRIPADAHPEAWAACCACLQQRLGVGEDVAGGYVERAFAWGARARAFWRHEKREAAPDVAQLEAVMGFLTTDLGLQDNELAAVVKGCPELLGCAVDTQLAANKARLQKEWRLEGPVLAKFVLRNPASLAYNVDCEGSCVGECNRCWARA